MTEESEHKWFLYGWSMLGAICALSLSVTWFLALLLISCPSPSSLTILHLCMWPYMFVSFQSTHDIWHKLWSLDQHLWHIAQVMLQIWVSLSSLSMPLLSENTFLLVILCIYRFILCAWSNWLAMINKWEFY